jgi:hypothetical protein
MRYGLYASKRSRDEYGQELRKAHFNLGGGGEGPSTTYKRDYVPLGSGQDSQRGMDGVSLRATHFALGLDKAPAGSSYAHDYNKKNADKVGLNSATLADLRATHYALGTAPGDFCSVNRQDYQPPELGKKDAGGKDDMTGKMRGHSHRFGNAEPLYQSSSAAAFSNRPPMSAGKAA